MSSESSDFPGPYPPETEEKTRPGGREIRSGGLHIRQESESGLCSKGIVGAEVYLEPALVEHV